MLPMLSPPPLLLISPLPAPPPTPSLLDPSATLLLLLRESPLPVAPSDAGVAAASSTPPVVPSAVAGKKPAYSSCYGLNARKAWVSAQVIPWIISASPIVLLKRGSASIPKLVPPPRNSQDTDRRNEFISPLTDGFSAFVQFLLILLLPFGDHAPGENAARLEQFLHSLGACHRGVLVVVATPFSPLSFSRRRRCRGPVDVCMLNSLSGASLEGPRSA